MNGKLTDAVFRALDSFRIEIPSWGFANTGTRFGKFVQPGAATTTEEKFSDAGQVHGLTGICPTVALHVLWDLPNGARDVDTVKAWPIATACGPAPSIRISSRIRSTSTDLSAILIRAVRAEALRHSRSEHRHREGTRQPRHFVLVYRWLELSGHGQHSGA